MIYNDLQEIEPQDTGNGLFKNDHKKRYNPGFDNIWYSKYGAIIESC